jgi:hypothetical protein
MNHLIDESIVYDARRFNCNKLGSEGLRMSPDFGLIELSKKIVNMISDVPYYCFEIRGYNAIEVFAVSRKG